MAASRSDESPTNTASGIVWVRPWRLPAKVTVAPNSPRARAQASTTPARKAGAIIGIVTRRNTVKRDAPSDAAAVSKRRSTPLNAPSTVSTRNGIATNVLATTTPHVENGSRNPVAS